MPARVNGKKPSNGFEVVFADVKLNSETAEQFRSWVDDKKVDHSLEIADCLSRAWKVSITEDNTNNCFIASMTCKDDRSKNHNLCVSSRSSDWYEALLMTVYKISVMFSHGVIPQERQSNNWG